MKSDFYFLLLLCLETCWYRKLITSTKGPYICFKSSENDVLLQLNYIVT